MDWLKGLFTPASGPKVRFRAVTEAYDLIDTVAERVDTQLIVHSDGYAIRDREPVGLYKLKDHDAMLVWDSPIIVETGLFRRPETRSRWVLQEAYHIWLGYAEGTLKAAKAKLSFDASSLRGISVAVGGTVFVLCIIMAIVLSATGGSDDPQTQPRGEESHGFVDDPLEDTAAPAGETDAAGGAAGEEDPPPAPDAGAAGDGAAGGGQ